MRRLVLWVIFVGLSQGLVLFLLSSIVPGLAVSSLWAAILTALTVIVVVTLTWPTIYRIASRFHPLLFPVASFFLIAVAVRISAEIVDALDPNSVFINDFVESILVALVLTFTSTLFGALFALDEDAAYSRFVVKPLVQRYRSTRHLQTAGFIFIEIDGLARPILERAIARGDMPTLARWLNDGHHKLTSWEPDLSSQTSSSQAGILLGDNTGIPAFRWWDKPAGKLMVSSKMATARDLEARLSTGDGLLAGGGSSRFNVFSGDAPDCVATFSRIGSGSGGGQTSYFAYFSNPYMLARTLGLFVAEVIREIFQAQRQRFKQIEPRIHRSLEYSLVRGGTNVFLQEAGAFMVASDMLRGVPAVYCTFFAYDEVAHHSGIDRSDSFKVLRRLDQMIARLARVAEQTPRPYHLIVLSDHGQSQGATFRQRYGETLGELVDRCTGDVDVTTLDLADEGYSGLSAALSEAIQRDNRSSRLTRRLLRDRLESDAGTVNLEPDEQRAQQTVASTTNRAVVLASGNLGLISFPEWPERLTLETISAQFPMLLAELNAHPGVGFIVMRSEQDGAVVLSSEGIYYLDHDYFVGENPLQPYGPNAARHLRRENAFDNAPDILVMSMYDPETGEVAAFEELVGSHGGLGGTQIEPFVLHPVELVHDDVADPIIGAGHLHRVLKGWISSAQGSAS